ncbi:MAG TPA: winged helix DNA-binding domain-containing protein [Candidatus Bathyarchaeia archaeon]
MTGLDILHLRLQNTGISASPFKSSEDVVAHLGAVQAQDFAAAKWAVGMRMQKATDETVEKSFNEGTFLRTHVMRPTWHFVLPEDIRWMLELTGQRVMRILAPYNKKLKITKEVLSQSQAVIEKALEGKKNLTRAELADQLEKKNLTARGQRLAHILVYAELNGLICSGPRRGKQFTYALLEEIVPKLRKLNREEALGRLVLKYFTSHGPAQNRDFAWWSGLSAKDTDEGLNLIKPKLNQTNLNGKTYWFSSETEDERLDSSTLNSDKQAFLLSIYDEYTIAYKDRSDISEERDIERMLSKGNALTGVIILNGKAIGTWKRVSKENSIEIKLNPFKKLNEDKLKLIKEAAEKYGNFLNKEVSILF